jgi:hypothetical protein
MLCGAFVSSPQCTYGDAGRVEAVFDRHGREIASRPSSHHASRFTAPGATDEIKIKDMIEINDSCVGGERMIVVAKG